MMRRRTPVPPALPQTRLVVPMLGATGGTGRSTLAYLLAAYVSEHARTVVLDTAPEPASPWRAWHTRPGAGSGPPPDDAAVSAQQVFAAAATVATGTGGQFSVLTARSADRETHAAKALAEQLRLVELFMPRVAVIDTDIPLLAAVTDLDQHPTQQPQAAPWGWLTVPQAAPVLSAPASGKGIGDLLATIHTLQQHGLATDHLTIAVVAIATPDLPRRVQAGLTLLEPLVRGIVRVPHEPRLHATGTPSWARTSPRVRVATEQLLQILTARTSTTVCEPRRSIPSPQPSGDPTPTAGGTDALTHPC